jgi:hypothetical protein
MKVTSVNFEYVADEDLEVRIDKVPKSVMKAVAIQFGVKPDFEGVTEFVLVTFQSLRIKLCRITTRDDLIQVNGI